MNYVLIAVPTKMQYINGKTKTKSVKRSVSVTVLMISEKSKNCKMIKLFHVFDIDVPYYLLNKKKKKKQKKKKKKKKTEKEEEEEDDLLFIDIVQYKQVSLRFLSYANSHYINCFL